MATNGTKDVAVRRSRLGEIEDLRETVRGLFDWRVPFPARTRRLFEGLQHPAVDVFERDGKVVVKAEMPGIPAEKIEVTASDGELRISGEREEEKEVREADFYRSERTYGSIFRAIPLPPGCDVDQIEASAKDGVIEVVIPKKATAIGKKIEVKSA